MKKQIFGLSLILRFIWPQPFEATLGQKNNRTIQKRTGSTVVDFRWVIARVVKCFHIFLTPVLQQLSYVVGLGSDREKISCSASKF